MNRLTAVCDSSEKYRLISVQLKDLFEPVFVSLDKIEQSEPPDHFCIVAVDLKSVAQIFSLRQWLKARPPGCRLIVMTEKGSRLQEAQAFALGATHVVHRIDDIAAALIKPMQQFAALAGAISDLRSDAHRGVTAALGALTDAFAVALIGGPLDRAVIDKAGDAIIEQIGGNGLLSWIETVRRHHSQTYQHSLLVTGLATDFGHYLGFASRDLKRLSFGGILHDVGKARVPIAILEKPAALDEKETNLMRRHPLFGGEALASVSDLPAEMMDVVLHHHEYLDGSGYPHGLSASQLSDLMRTLTIADIFGALIENRAYKSALPFRAAYQVLVNMGSRLDQDLVREFGGLSRSVLKAA
ncbi:MAG TPA: HD domain-containing phosphohydrolase [Xanthobacteraceae bacterium]|jgi:putative nucleotidyltransferase with HDIG domain|nr:HD domain-containing phosphohydrolase [Xanthobacteraceae bacterium]